MSLRLEYVPLLEKLRELYAQPRGFERFRDYVRTLTAGGADMELPIAGFNPMGKEAAAERLDGWIAVGADDAAAAGVAEAGRRLAAVDDELKVAVVLADDAAGGWTNRATSEMSERFDPRGTLRRGWAVCHVWTSDDPDAAAARAGAMAAVYRTLWLRAHGMPTTLRAMMRQEGLAACFSGVREPELSPDAAAEIATRIDPHRDSDAYPIQVAALYGDASAAELGYTTLALPARAGYALARYEVLRAGVDPITALLAAAD